MKRLLLVHNLVHGQSVVHELDDKDFAVELVEGDPEETDEQARWMLRVAFYPRRQRITSCSKLSTEMIGRAESALSRRNPLVDVDGNALRASDGGDHPLQPQP